MFHHVVSNTHQPSAVLKYSDANVNVSNFQADNGLIFQAGNGLSGENTTSGPSIVQASSSETATDDFVILSKNVRGLTNDDRLEELEAELSLVKGWDIVVLTETWRKSTNEYFETHQGNIHIHLTVAVLPAEEG